VAAPYNYALIKLIPKVIYFFIKLSIMDASNPHYYYVDGYDHVRCRICHFNYSYCNFYHNIYCPLYREGNKFDRKLKNMKLLSIYTLYYCNLQYYIIMPPK
jgi:hypothetical protein